MNPVEVAAPRNSTDQFLNLKHKAFNACVYLLNLYLDLYLIFPLRNSRPQTLLLPPSFPQNINPVRSVGLKKSDWLKVTE